MRIVFLCLLSLPLICLAQKKNKGYFALDASLHFKSQSDPGFGGLVSGNLPVNDAFFVGLQLGAFSLPNTDGVYVPIQAKFTIAPSLHSNKISPVMLIEPGYGIHNKTYSYGLNEEGGFTFFAAAGLLLPASSKGGLCLAVGYSSFGLKAGNEKSNLEMVAVRLGVFLR